MALAEFAIVDTTLREGEQFANGDFTTSDKIEIARTLAAIGIEYIELTSPAVSPRALADCEAIAGLGLTSRIVAHIRCHADDARIALGRRHQHGDGRIADPARHESSSGS